MTPRELAVLEFELVLDPKVCLEAPVSWTVSHNPVFSCVDKAPDVTLPLKISYRATLETCPYACDILRCQEEVGQEKD